MKKIVWLTRSIWPNTIGGVELRVERLSALMKQSGYWVSIFCGDLPLKEKLELADGREVRGLGFENMFCLSWRLKPMMKILHTLRGCPALDCDCIYTPDPIIGVGMLLKREKIPMIYCPGGTIWGSKKWNFPEKANKKVLDRLHLNITHLDQNLWAERFCLKHANRIIAVSQMVKRQMEIIEPSCSKRIRVVYDGADKPFKNNLKIKELRREWGNVEFVAVISARLHRIKNIDHAINAWALVKHESRLLLICGDGEEREVLKRLVCKLKISKKVKFLGTRLDIPELLSAANLMILPSEYEAFGIAVAEAMRAGIPVITLQNINGVTEVAASGELNIDCVTGFCTDPLNPADMAQRVDQLAISTILQKQMGISAEHRGDTMFSWEKAVKGYLNTGLEVVGGKK